MLLETAGYSVTSAHAFVSAYQECSHGEYDLIVVGHSVPREDKTVLLAAIRKNGNAPVLSIRRHGDMPLAGAEYSIDSDEGPSALLAMIQGALKA
jgi:DNA-binding response OmpR family regulator